MSQHLIVQNCSQNRINMMTRWASMWSRCYDADSISYEHYGGRGIRVCQEWADFSRFYEFFGDPPFEKATIGRIDNNGNYEPSNCEWQTQEQQNNNTTRSRLIQHNGKLQSIRDWAKEYDIGSRRLWERLSRGWSMDRALTTPSPKDFHQELAERREENRRSWEVNGHLYTARSRWRKGHRLSLPTQDLLAVEGVEQTRQLQVQASKVEQTRQMQVQASKAERRRRIDDQTAGLIMKYHQDGASIRSISGILCIPKSTVHFHIKKNLTNP